MNRKGRDVQPSHQDFSPYEKEGWVGRGLGTRGLRIVAAFDRTSAVSSVVDCRGSTRGRSSPTPYTRCHRNLSHFSCFIRIAGETVENKIQDFLILIVFRFIKCELTFFKVTKTLHYVSTNFEWIVLSFICLFSRHFINIHVHVCHSC